MAAIEMDQQFEDAGLAHLFVARQLTVLFFYRTADEGMQRIVTADVGAEDVIFLCYLRGKVGDVKDHHQCVVRRLGAPAGVQLVAVGDEDISGYGMKMLLPELEIRLTFYYIMNFDVFVPMGKEDIAGCVPVIVVDLDGKLFILQRFVFVEIEFRYGHHPVSAN